MTNLFDLSNDIIIDFESNNGDNSALSDLSLNEDKENLFFLFHAVTKDEEKEKLNQKPKFNIKKAENESKDKKRKDKGDEVRKKIKSSFLKNLLIRINELLKSAGSLFIFESFPQNFIKDITLPTNFEVMHLTYLELFNYTHEKVVEENKYELGKYQERANKVAEKKYVKNMKTLGYLKNNSGISERSGWEIIKKMKYIDLLKAFFTSKEFENSVNELKQKEGKDYINNYLYFASTYIDYFQSYKPNDKRKKNKKKLKAEFNQNSGNGTDNSQLIIVPHIIPFPLFEADDILNNDNLFLPLFHSSGIYDLTNQGILFTDELFEDFH